MYSVIVLLSSFASHLENSTKTDLGTSLSSDAKKVVGDDIRSFSKLDRGFKFFFSLLHKSQTFISMSKRITFPKSYEMGFKSIHSQIGSGEIL